MKRVACIILSLIFAIFALAGCAKGTKDTESFGTKKKDKPKKMTDTERYDDTYDADADDADEPENEEEMKEYKENKSEEDKKTVGENEEDEKDKEKEEEKEEEKADDSAYQPAENGDSDSDRDKKKAENAQKRSINGTLKNFMTITLDGRGFTFSDIAKYDITVINFWGTYCGPCISEMPDLAEFYNNLPAGVNFVTYCTDGAVNEEEAQSIIDDAGLAATVIVGSSGDFKSILGQIRYVPTTIFVNKYGEIVGYELIGRSEDLFKAYKDRISDALAETDR